MWGAMWVSGRLWCFCCSLAGLVVSWACRCPLSVLVCLGGGVEGSSLRLVEGVCPGA